MGNMTGERGADSNTASPDLLHTVSLVRTSYAVAVHCEHAAPLRTCWHTHTYEADHAGPCPAKKPKETRPPPKEDEWVLSVHWPAGHAWPPAEIEGVPCTEVRNVKAISVVCPVPTPTLRRFSFLLPSSTM